MLGVLMKLPEHFQDLPDIFARNDIVNEGRLEEVLSHSRESGSSNYPTWGYPGVTRPKTEYELGRDLAMHLCWYLTSISEKGKLLPSGPGINQCSTVASSRVGDVDIRKALFLANTATVFTGHRLSYHNDRSTTAFFVEDVSDDHWTVSHDYVRDLFRYRDAISSGPLMLVPAAVTYAGTTGGMWGKAKPSYSSTLSSSDAAYDTRVLTPGLPAQTLEELVKNYHKNRQVVTLPALQVPWIENIDTALILKVREENSDEFTLFQKSYHEALLRQMENFGTADFSSVSIAINEEIIGPALRRLDRKYRRTVSLHRSLRLAGASTALLPVVALLVAGRTFREFFTPEFAPTLAASTMNAIITIWVNAIYKRKAIEELQDENFYILWRMEHSRKR
jgi:hypothetical protein